MGGGVRELPGGAGAEWLGLGSGELSAPLWGRGWSADDVEDEISEWGAWIDVRDVEGVEVSEWVGRSGFIDGAVPLVFCPFRSVLLTLSLSLCIYLSLSRSFYISLSLSFCRSVRICNTPVLDS